MGHKAIVAKVTETIEIPNADRVHICVVLGENCITSKDVKVGDVGILFPADLQLSEEFCFENNLNRDKTKNKDVEKAGFFEVSRRVRAQPFLKVRSDCLFMGLDCVAYAGEADLTLGFQFDEINGKKVCQKYINEKTMKASSNQSATAKRKVAVPDFKEHVDTEHFKHNVHKIKTGDILYFHSKRHGTSGRTGLHQVEQEVVGHAARAVKRFKELTNTIVVGLINKRVFDVNSAYKWEYITGSRRVVMKEDTSGFHGSNQFRFDITEQLKPYVEKGMTLYYEIVGYVNGSPIMSTHNIENLKDKKYTEKYGKTITYSYGCKEHEYKVFVYRITVQDVSGNIRDLSQKELEKWCKDRNIGYTLEVHQPVVYNGDEMELRSLVEGLTERWDVLSEDIEDPSHLSEGVIIRCENGNPTPLFLKSKAYAFRVCEGNETAINIEDAS